MKTLFNEQLWIEVLEYGNCRFVASDDFWDKFTKFLKGSLLVMVCVPTILICKFIKLVKPDLFDGDLKNK